MEVTQKRLAQILGISDRRVRQLREEGLFLHIENSRKYSLENCVQEYIEYKIKAETNSGSYLSKEKEQAEHEKIKKQISIIKLRKLKREVHEAVDVELYWNEMLINFRNRLASIPSKISPQIVGENDINVIIELVTKEINETLEELSSYDSDKISQEEDIYEDDDSEELE